MEAWIITHEALLWWACVASAVMLVASLVVIPAIIVRMPADYFVSASSGSRLFRERHSVVRTILLVGKNVLGAVLVLLGIVMSLPLVPGQGILCILIGLGLMNFPGKRAVERWIVQRKVVHRAINWMRKRANRPPIEVPLSTR